MSHGFVRITAAVDEAGLKAGKTLQAVFDLNRRPIIANQGPRVRDEIISDVYAIRGNPGFRQLPGVIRHFRQWHLVETGTVLLARLAKNRRHPAASIHARNFCGVTPNLERLIEVDG